MEGISKTLQGSILALTGEASDAVQVITSGLTAVRATGATILEPQNLSYLAGAYAKSGRLNEARRCIHDSLTVTEQSKESWSEAEINRVAGEIALMSPQPNSVEAEGYFERALAVARQQQAKSWELRAANDWFFKSATDVHWDMHDPVCDGKILYARYVFSYKSLLPEAGGRRAMFEGLQLCAYAMAASPTIARSPILAPASSIWISPPSAS